MLIRHFTSSIRLALFNMFAFSIIITDVVLLFSMETKTKVIQTFLITLKYGLDLSKIFYFWFPFYVSYPQIDSCEGFSIKFHIYIRKFLVFVAIMYHRIP